MAKLRLPMLEKHQQIALTLFIVMALILIARHGFQGAMGGNLVLLILLGKILFYRQIAYFSGIGFWERRAKDYGSENKPLPYAVFFWMLYLIAIGFLLFRWRLY